MRYRLSAIKCAECYGVKRAAVKCYTSPVSIYRWRKLYYVSNKDIGSLQNGSRRPHSRPNAHTQAEIIIRNLRRRNPRLGLQDFWLRLRQYGYTRSQPALLEQAAISGLYQYTAIDESSRYRIFWGGGGA